MLARVIGFEACGTIGFWAANAVIAQAHQSLSAAVREVHAGKLRFGLPAHFP